jgi:peptide/nickel transport system substrate-binding protein
MLFKKVLKNYSPRDRLLSATLAGLIGLVLVFNIGQSIIEKSKLSGNSKTYTEGVIGEISVINPLFRDLNSLNRDISTLMYAGLTKYNPSTKTFEPDLATFTINDNSTVYTFTLKEDIYWHDGEPVTIDDVLFTYKTIQSPDFKNVALRQSLSSVTIENSAINEIQFTLKSPNAFFLSQTDIGILPKHIYQEVPISEIGQEVQLNKPELLVGAGRYYLDEIELVNPKLKRIILKQSKDYHGLPSAIKTVRFFVFPDIESLIATKDSLNAINNFPNELIDQLSKKTFSTKEYLLPQYTAIFLNTDLPELTSRNLRVVLKRVANSLEFESILTDKQSISRPFFLYESIQDNTQLNPTIIEALLEDDGYYINSDTGLTEKDGEPLELSLLVQNFNNNQDKNDEYKILAENLVKSFKKVGITIKPQFYEADTFAKLLAAREFDLVLYGHSLGTDLDSFSFWHSSQTGITGLNISNYKNIATDSLLERVRVTNDIEERNDLLLKINEKLVADVPAIFLYTDKHLFMFDNRIKNRKILSSYAFSSDRFYDIENWELDN